MQVSVHNKAKRGVAALATEPKAKRPRVAQISKGKGRAKEEMDESDWPEYFRDALNTVLAFCSSRNHLATTFHTVRASVESLIKKPLELTAVAEIKALLPEIVRFAYIPKIELAVEHSPNFGRPDFERDIKASQASSTIGVSYDDNEHVLVLELEDGVKSGRKIEESGLVMPPAMSPEKVKKLIEKRNAMFARAVKEYFPPMIMRCFVGLTMRAGSMRHSLLIAAARDHVPVDPNANDEPGDKTIPDPEHRSSIPDLITEVEGQDWYRGQILNRKVFEEKLGQMGLLDPPLSDTISAALREARNIKSLYSHQVEAITALHNDEDVIVSTSTASGKSVIYQVPLLRFLEEDADSKAIFIYPTKALAQDQRAALEQLLAACPGLEHISVATYDGDTPQDARPLIRDTASIIFTNFDTIHASILPHEEKWRRFLKHLKLIAVDELHYYHDLFGSHIALVMRRLRRICSAVGNRRIRFVSCSATISRPVQHMKAIFGLENVHAVTEDGAPAGRKDFLVWSASLPFDGKRTPISTLADATTLMRFLMKRGVRVILFCQTRKTCELVMKTLRVQLSSEGRYDILQKVMPYRGGYSPTDRRKIEYDAFSGKLLGLIATNALELGVDIGVLDAVLVLGFPFSVASLRQQIGRAGRRARDALGVLIIGSGPLDQHYAESPSDLFDRPTDDLIIELDSKVVLEAHLQCAAHEMPLRRDDSSWFGPLMQEICEAKLHKDKDGWYHTHPKFLPYPAKEVSIRGVEEDKYNVIDLTALRDLGGAAKMIEEVEVSRALFELYEGAIFLHQGKTFLVKEVSHDSKQAKVIRTDVNWITSPRYSDVDAVETRRIREIKGSSHRAFYGRVDVTTVVFGIGDKILDIVDVQMPPYERSTTGMWIDVSKKAMDLMSRRSINAAEAIHSAEHAFLNRFTMASDLRTECKAAEKEYKATESRRKRPARLVFYDVAAKGAGIAAKAFDHGAYVYAALLVSDILHRTAEAVNTCECHEGCANCIASFMCKENNAVFSKVGAQIILNDILGIMMGEDNIPYGDAPRDERMKTVVDPPSVGVAQGVQVEKYDE
ncbi:P-loop containing nucleoside triphosphate hydrolase protein [Auriscalpium vulgare]|uniref:P-loop containing nucleoside triphosphate hydrolase protein n=1 Tax=Auriscalpium vulgare TaxID=40419 RepID=A0ACB8S5I0_9AGAM|nr:P-loop containing nucleoside triphosphate hydrolase protein [Auriscalpium vulgare]